MCQGLARKLSSGLGASRSCWEAGNGECALSALRAESRAVMEGLLDTGGMEGVPSSSEGRALDSACTPGNHIHSLTSSSLGTKSTLNADPTGVRIPSFFLITTAFPQPAQILLPIGTWASVCKQLWWPQLGRGAAIYISEQKPRMTFDLLGGEAALHGKGLSQC